MKNLCIYLIICMTLLSCGGNSSNQSNNRYESENSENNARNYSEPKNNDGESGIYSRKGSEINDNNIDNEAKEEYADANDDDDADYISSTCNTPQREYGGNKETAEDRMKVLCSEYTWSSGKVKRGVVRKILNDEGYRKKNGRKFVRKDIPIYPKD